MNWDDTFPHLTFKLVKSYYNEEIIWTKDNTLSLKKVIYLYVILKE